MTLAERKQGVEAPPTQRFSLARATCTVPTTASSSVLTPERDAGGVAPRNAKPGGRRPASRSSRAVAYWAVTPRSSLAIMWTSPMNVSSRAEEQ
jgi:hypothetical protein